MKNMNMNPIFSLKNFRSFGKEGADFELAPITVLTGCNSAGKSSLVKALMLLSKKSNTISSGAISYSQTLELTSKKLNLGGYKTVANGSETISMSYTIWSPDLQDNLTVTIEFCENRHDILNSGVLYHLVIKKSDGTIICQNEREAPCEMGLIPIYNYDSIKSEFDRFYAVGCYIQLLSMLKTLPELEDNDDYIVAVSNCEHAKKVIKEKLLLAGLSESEASALWNKYNHETWKSVVAARTFNPINGSKASLSLSDIIEEPERFNANMMLREFLEHIVGNALSPYFTQKIEYIDSASAQIARLYSSEDENKICSALRSLNKRNIDYSDNVDGWIDHPAAAIYKPGIFLNRWIKKFGVGDNIEIIGAEEGLGFMAYLKSEDKRRLLADEGYGITQLISLLLQIDNRIPLFISADEESLIQDIKTVPEYEPQIICVEEPENHLHPKFQSLLAEMFVEAYKKYNIHFVMETHSEYRIRKLQVMVADKENNLASSEVSLNYVEKDGSGVSTNRKIEIREDGGLGDSFGPGFYDEADALAIQLFRNKPILS